jgi:hypothetical protein
MNINHWNWAVWAIVILLACATCIRIGLHGKPMTGTWNAGWAIFNFLLSAVLFWQAGLFK